MIVLALDPSLTTGWATNADDLYYRGNAGYVKIDTMAARHFGGPFDAPQDKLAARLAAAQYWLEDVTKAIRPDLFVIERQFKNETQCALESVFIACAGARSAMLLRPPPNSWKSHAKRNGYEKLPDPEGAVVDAMAMVAWALANHRMEEAA